MRLIDITRDLTTVDAYPGDPETTLESVRSIGDASDCNLSVLHTCVHTGTHADAPLHFIDGGASIEQMPPEAFIGPCTVLEVDEPVITGEFVNEHFPTSAERILIKSGGEAFFMDSAAEEAACLPHLRLIGTDAVSVGIHGSQIRPHKAFLSKGIPILEGLDLSEVEPGQYFLLALPMKIGGSEGAPVRAVLADEYIFWNKQR